MTYLSFRLANGEVSEFSYSDLFNVAYAHEEIGQYSYRSSDQYSQQEIETARNELRRRASRIKLVFDENIQECRFWSLCRISERRIKDDWGDNALPLTDIFGNKVSLCYSRWAYYDERTNLILQHIVNNSTPFTGYQQILDLNARLRKESLYILTVLKNAIADSFRSNGVNPVGLYTQTDLKQEKLQTTFQDRVRLIDYNVQKFIKSGRYFAALSYLRDTLDRLRYWFLVASESDTDNQKVIIYSNLGWTIDRDGGYDLDGEVVAKVIENLFLLFSITKSNAALVEVYQSFSGKHDSLLKVDVLIRLVESLVEQKAVNQVEPVL